MDIWASNFRKVGTGEIGSSSDPLQVAKERYPQVAPADLELILSGGYRQIFLPQILSSEIIRGGEQKQLLGPFIGSKTMTPCSPFFFCHVTFLDQIKRKAPKPQESDKLNLK